MTPLCAQRGVALAIVLWFIAGMSLLVAGIVAQARVDTRMAQVHVAQAKTVAAGDGAVQLMLAELVIASEESREISGVLAGSYRLGEAEVRVRLVPVDGLIDIDSAAPELLQALFAAVGVDDEQARLVVQNVLQSRTAGGGRPGRSGAIQLDAMEDLLRVPGMSRTLLDAIRDFIVVGQLGQGGINWSAAPDEVLAVLQQMDGSRADAVRARRADAAGTGGGGLATAYRADAVLRYGDRDWLRRVWIEMAAAPGSMLPWSIVRTEPPRVLYNDN